MKKVEFKLDPERLTLEDLIALEDMEGNRVKWRFVRNFLARFLVDEAGEFVETEAARNVLTGMNLAQLREAQGSVMAAIQELQESAVPPANGGS